MFINACGPLFVSDYATSNSEETTENTIQGVMVPLVSCAVPMLCWSLI